MCGFDATRYFFLCRLMICLRSGVETRQVLALCLILEPILTSKYDGFKNNLKMFDPTFYKGFEPLISFYECCFKIPFFHGRKQEAVPHCVFWELAADFSHTN